MKAVSDSISEAGGGERGFILLTTLILMVAAMGFVGAMIGVAQIESRQAAVDLDKVAASAAADAGDELAVAAIIDAAAAFTPITTAQTATVAVGSTRATYTITPVGSPFATASSSALTGISQIYTITSVARSPDGVATTTVHRAITVTSSHLFQFGVFYNSDLEVAPGPTMTFGGRIHSNGDMYVTAGNTLNLNTNYVHAAGSIYRYGKTSGRGTGTVTTQNLATGATSVNWPTSLDSSSSTFPTDAQSQFGGTVVSGAMGQQQLQVPGVQTIAPGGFYDQNAGRKVTYSGSGNPVVNVEGVDLPSASVTALMTAGAIKVIPPASGGYYDDRQGTYVGLVQINMQLLQSSAILPADFNGLMYLSRSDATTGAADGFRIVSG
ncbi:MAG: hypothetical protein ACRELB_27415, partial [Polyangiaceae bacterium]